MIKKLLIRFFCCLVFFAFTGTVHAQTWKQLDDKLTSFYNAGNIDSAILYATKEITQAEKEFGKIDTNYCTSLGNLGFLYKLKGDYAKAEPLMVQSLTITKKVFGTEHPAYATDLNNLALFYQDIGIYSKAESMLIEALAIRKKALGPNHSKYAETLNNLGILYQDMGNFSQAEPLLREALAINKKALGVENPDYATSLNNLAFLYKILGDYTNAESLFVSAMAIDKKILGAQSLEFATDLDNLGTVYHDKGDYAKAEPLLIEAMAIRKKALGTHNKYYTFSLDNLASLYEDIGEYGKAESLKLSALEITKKINGADNPDYANALNLLGAFYLAEKNYAKAELRLTEALAVEKKVYGPEHPYYAISLGYLANLYYAAGDYSKAEPLLIEEMNIIKKAYGSENRNYATSLNDLGRLYDATGAYSKAEPLLVQSLAIIKNVLGTNHPQYAIAVNQLAWLYVHSGSYSKAEPLFLEAQKNILQNISKNFSFLSEAEKEKYIASVSDDFARYQNFYKNYIRVKPSITTEFYDIELATKGMILSSSITLSQTIQASGNKEAIHLFDHWIALKNSLAKLYAQPIAKRQLNTDSIESLANDDEKQLARLSAAFRQGKLLSEARWRTVQQSLKPNEVAIEFASFRYCNDKRWIDTTMYSALVLRKNDTYPTMVNLCRQDQLDSLLTKTGNTQGAFISNLYRGATIDAAATSAATRRKLYKLVWKPIEKLLHKGDHIYYAPSGLLHQVAFAAIPREDGKLLSDRYQLTQLSSTAMLLQTAPAVDTKDLTIAAYGGIKYDASESELANLATKDTQRFVSRSLRPDSTRGGTSFDPLPGTSTEINGIALLGKQYHVPVTLYTGINATEESYKRNGVGASPRIIHIATHGFFFPDPKNAKPDNAEPSGEKQQFTLSDNPLNRAGLAFAGANHAWRGEAVPPGMEDGILTAYEASNVPLFGTQLVVLSACETGLGDIKGSEGVFGLQRAFKAAGATYIMMSLWQVPDTETAEFMRYFYKDLFSGQSIEKAFLSSQTTMKNKYRNDPYKWAAFVLMR